MASFHALIPWNPLFRPNSTPTTTNRNITTIFNFNNGIGIHSFSCKIHGGCRFYWNYGKSFDLFAPSSSSNGNRLEAAAVAAADKEYEDEEFIVVNFYRFVLVKDPEEELSKHLLFMKVFPLSLCYSFLGESCFALFCNVSSLMSLRLLSAAALPNCRVNRIYAEKM